MAKRDDAESQPGYEEAVDRLEAIVERIESGEIGLEESIAAYEQGVALLKRCREILGRAEQRITELDASALEGRAGPESSETG